VKWLTKRAVIQRIKVIDNGGRHKLREWAASYKALFGPEKRGIGQKNTYFWDINYE
jgi:hypothetical protein